MSTALFIFQISIRSPTKQLIIMTVLVSLSMTYRRTITDWNTLKNTDRTDRPSRVLRLRQNCMSKREKGKEENEDVLLLPHPLPFQTVFVTTCYIHNRDELYF